MKKTELKDVYCKPKSGEWTNEMIKMQTPFNGTDICGLGMFNRKDRTEIPVSRFIDLLEDRIVGWRLEEIGFNHVSHKEDIEEYWEIVINGYVIVFDTQNVMLDKGIINIKKFTELETLIGFLR